MPSIRQVWKHIQQGDYGYIIDVKDTCMHNPIAKHHHFLHFLAQQTLSMEGFTIWDDQIP